jgi:hypothetical protein
MNEKSKAQFAKYEHGDLLGKSLIDCHPEPARTILLDMLKEPKTNSYTIEKRGVRKMIHQSPWFEHDIFKGVIEISFEIPIDLPHHLRV